MTYLELVNKAIRESGVDLEELTSANFANPPDRYHAKFKGWVNDAWKEIQMERNWEFTQTMHLKTNTVPGSANQGVVNNYTSPINELTTIQNNTDCTYPYLVIQADTGVSLGNLITGNWIRGRRSGAAARLISTAQVDVNAGSYSQGTNPEQGFRLRYYIAGGTGAFEFGEPVSIYNSTNTVLIADTEDTVVDMNAYRIISFFGLENLISSATEFSNSTDGFVIDKHSFKISPAGLLQFNTVTNPYSQSVDVTNFGGYDHQKLDWLEWDEFKMLAHADTGTALGKDSGLGVPKYVSKDTMGYYRFYPTFDYRAPTIGWDVYCDVQIQIIDIPSNADTFIPKPMPVKFHDMISWRAVMYYANDDSKPDKWRTARSRYEFYKRRLEEQLIEQPKWQSNPYKRGLNNWIR